jgi:hypothetical protein
LRGLERRLADYDEERKQPSESCAGSRQVQHLRQQQGDVRHGKGMAVPSFEHHGRAGERSGQTAPPVPYCNYRACNRDSLQGQHLAEPRVKQNCRDGRYRLCFRRAGYSVCFQQEPRITDDQYGSEAQGYDLPDLPLDRRVRP